ncbi:unnamed protein product [Brachionus calyciflorus]|uniref:glutathione transferase n=1 Tax=Brachionus calyciflorus TaxID=104777 RepID=A0A814QU67_9BILA|nr:unnamed protein product [Brachionus calyciflorus]
MSTYTLTYFNGRGRGELTRLILVAAAVQFEDVRVTWPDDWPGTAQADSPLGQLPYLTIDGIKIPHSLAIARLVAKRFNLAGSDDLEQAKTDAVVDTITDLQNAFYLVAFKDEPDALIAKFIAEDANTHLERIEKIVTLYGTEGYSVGSSLKWSDLHLFDITSTFLALDVNILDKYPRIQAVRRTVESNDKIQAYLKDRPETSF